jgi:hypothetical protein
MTPFIAIAFPAAILLIISAVAGTALTFGTAWARFDKPPMQRTRGFMLIFVGITLFGIEWVMFNDMTGLIHGT